MANFVYKVNTKEILKENEYKMCKIIEQIIWEGISFCSHIANTINRLTSKMNPSFTRCKDLYIDTLINSTAPSTASYIPISYYEMGIFS